MILRSIGAVVAGVGANLLAIPFDVALMAAGLFAASDPSAGEAQYLLALSYRSAFAVLGGWVTARLAPSSPMTHALVLGGLGVLLASAGAAAQWHLGHHWYPLLLVAVSLPASWGGARLSTRSTT
jgi:hypothetical protein